MFLVTGAEVPIPLPAGYAHIADVEKVHLGAAMRESGEHENYDDSSPVDYSTAFAIVAEAFPKAVEEGVFAPGRIDALLASWDSIGTEKELKIKN